MIEGAAGRLDAIDLQVATGALRAACEEMGAVLIRAAHSSNIKERRDASTALFDARGEMVMQAEHIPVHLGAMPAAVAAVLGERHVRDRKLVPQRPLRGRHPPARHHGHHAGVRRRCGWGAARLRGQPRASRRRRRGRPRLDAGRQHVAGPGGRGDLAAAADRGGDRTGDRARCANPASGARTCGHSWLPTAPATCGCANSHNRLGVEGLRDATEAVLDYAERRTRACLAQLPDGERHARGRARGARGRPAPRAASARRGRAAGARLQRKCASALGQSQLPAGRSRCRPAISRCAC